MSHCSERDAPRPPDATHRVIYSLYVEFDPLPDERGKSTALVVPLNRDGMPHDRPTGGRPDALRGDDPTPSDTAAAANA